MERYYFDYAASTPVDLRVEKAMRPYWSRVFGNPGALHWFGQEASAAVFEARQTIARALGCDYKEIIFTGSATEANNLALRGVVKTIQQFSDGTDVLPLQRREPSTPRLDFSLSAKPSKSSLHSYRTKMTESFLPKIIISAIEHESVLDTVRKMEMDGEIEVVVLPVSKNGIVDLKKLKILLDERTVLVSVMYANNEVGTIQPIAEISELIRNFRVRRSMIDEGRLNSNNKTSNLELRTSNVYPLLHTDAVQAFNYLPCNVDELGVDSLTLSAQKIYGPKGMGLLYVRRSMIDVRKNKKTIELRTSNFEPLITGGGQEFGFRSGTENVPAIVGFSKAVELAEKNRVKENERLKKLQIYFLSKLKKIAPRFQLNGDLENRLSNNINIYVPGVEDLVMKLDLAGFAVSLGAACSARVSSPSHVLKALGYSDERSQNSLRITFGRPTKKSSIDKLLKAMYNYI